MIQQIDTFYQSKYLNGEFIGHVKKTITRKFDRNWSISTEQWFYDEGIYFG